MQTLKNPYAPNDAVSSMLSSAIGPVPTETLMRGATLRQLRAFALVAFPAADSRRMFSAKYAAGRLTPNVSARFANVLRLVIGRCPGSALSAAKMSSLLTPAAQSADVVIDFKMIR